MQKVVKRRGKKGKKMEQRTIKGYFFPFFLVVVMIMILFGCSRNRIWELKKERLFSISIGNREEDLGVLREENGQFVGPEFVLFKNGFFYVVDTVNQKILKITTPGDIILTLAKGDRKTNSDEHVLRTKQRRYFHFNQIGKVSVDSENNIYIEDKSIQRMPEKEEIDILKSGSDFNDENSEVFVSSILKFDRLGTYLFRIGKYGRDTDPFYYIYRFDVNKEGDLIVLSTDDDWENWYYHRFNPEGELVFYYSLRSDEIVDSKNTQDKLAFIMDVVPECNRNNLIFWVSLYETSWDTEDLKKEEELWGEEIEIEDTAELGKEDKPDSESKFMRDLLNYRLLFYDLDSKRIDRTYRWETRAGFRKDTTEEFIGIDGESNGFLWKYVDHTKAIITIFRPNGSIIARRSLLFENNGVWTNLGVAVDGSISALKVDERFIHFYRWRSDKLISKKREKVTLKEFIRDKIEGFKDANR